MPHDAVAAAAVGARLVRRTLADDPETVGIVDVEQRTVAARHCGEGHKVWRVARHAVDAVHAHQARGVAFGGEQRIEMIGILEAKAPHRRAASLGDLAPVIDGLVRAGVQEDRPRGRPTGGITDIWMWVIVGRTSESSEPSSAVSRSSISSYSTGLPSKRDQLGCVPHLVQECRDPVDDLAVQIEPEVVA